MREMVLLQVFVLASVKWKTLERTGSHPAKIASTNHAVVPAGTEWVSFALGRGADRRL